jgi:4-diphosphocytidyl-2-C-methyl-D-erythritol kinase
MARVVTVRAFAKINLALRVKGLRPDGYHELQTVFQTIELADTLTFRACDGPFRLSCTRDDVPVDERNLVWRAAAALWDALGRPSPPAGVSVSIRKNIPPQAGLGGGSADAAATLLALARLWRVRVPAAALERLGAGLGADVPFFLCGGTALGLGRGDEIYPLADAPPSPLVVAYPAFGVQTSDAFGWFDAESAACHADVSARKMPESGLAIWRSDAACVVNDLEPCVVRRHPAIGDAVRRLRDGGATAAAMSGSGSAVFGLFPDARHAARAAARLAGKGWTAHVTRTLTRREASARFASPARPRRGSGAR